MSAVIQNEYTGNNSTTTYSFTFPYLKTSDIKASLDGVDTTAFTLPNATTLQFNTAPGSGVKIKIFRDTGVDDLTATFYAGSAIKSEDLNDNFTQNLYKTQEVGGRFISNLGGTMTGDLNMGEDTVIRFEGATDDAHETTLTVADPTADRTITFPNVTGNVVTTGDTGTVSRNMIAGDAINGGKIADNVINSEHYIDGSIDREHLAADIVDGTKIADDSINSEHYVADSIDTEHYAPGSVDTTALGADSVTNAKIADDSIDSEHYVNASIDNEHLANNSVSDDKIANNAITTRHLSDDCLDASHYGAGSVDATALASNAVTLVKMADNSVGTSELVNDSVTNAKIADDQIDSEHYVDQSIDTQHISDNAITNDKMADNSVNSNELVAGSIDTVHIGSVQVTDAKLASNSVTTAKITDANVTTAKIANDAITIGKLGCEQTTISDSDSHIPTSGAVVDYVAAQIAPLGGLEVIATEVAFPNTQPSSGVVISISDAGGVVVNGSGVSTTGRTVGGSTVTINGFPASLQSKTMAADIGLMVSSTGSSQTYTYHKILAKEADVEQLSNDINDFAARYRVGSSNPTSDLDAGDLFFNTSTSKLLVYNATNSAWEEAQSIGNFFISTFSEAFDGSRTQFTLSNAPANVQQVLLSLNGVVQKPGTAFTLSGSTVTLASAPASGTDYFAVVMGSTVNIGTPSNNTVSTAVLQDDSVTTAKIAAGAVTATELGAGSVISSKLASGVTDLVNDTSPQLGGDLDTNGHEISLDDNHAIKFGDGNDLEIKHDSANWIRSMGTHTLNFTVNGGSEYAAKMFANGAVELYHDNSKKFETTNEGAKVTGNLGINIASPDSPLEVGGTGPSLATIHHTDGGTNDEARLMLGALSSNPPDQRGAGLSARNKGAGHDLEIQTSSTHSAGPSTKMTVTAGGQVQIANDSGRLQLGASQDLQLYHNGSNSFITNNTGQLEIRSDTLLLQDNTSGHTMFKGVMDGATELYYNNTKRLETLSDGGKITGVLKIDRGSGIDTGLQIDTTATSGASRIMFRENNADKGQVAYSHDHDQIELVASSGNGAAIIVDQSHTAFHINSSGYITKPKNPIFHAYNGPSTVSANTDIVFTSERFDVGSGYNTSNGIYTVPRTGYYHFYGQVYRHQNNADAWWGFYINGSQASEARIATDLTTVSRGYSTLQCSLYYYMSAGDEIKMRNGTEGNIHCHTNFSYFSGNLVG